jgi:hypothetical protein
MNWSSYMGNISNLNQRVDLTTVAKAYFPVMVLCHEPDEIPLKFQKGFDGLDDLVFSILELPSTHEITLVRHENSPGKGTEVWVCPEEDVTQTLSEAFSELKLDDTDITWIHPDYLNDWEKSRNQEKGIKAALVLAQNLKEAFRACDLTPLVGKNMDYYVDLSKVRSNRAIAQVSAGLSTLQPEDGYATFLFTGHRGCGKSTELRRICDRFKSEGYRVIYLEADTEVDIHDVKYIDLYLLIMKHIAMDLTSLQIEFDLQILHSFEQWLKELTQETEETVERSIPSNFAGEEGSSIPFLAKLLIKLMSQIKGSHAQKLVIREKLQQDYSRFQPYINLLLDNASERLKVRYPRYKKGFLVIVDNLDRVLPENAEHLFFDYGVQLQELNCNLIYTVPISTVYSGQNLSSVFYGYNIMPMVNIYQFERDRCDLDYDEDALEVMESLISRRVEVDAIFETPEALEKLAKASGGHVRQLMKMMRSACLSAMADEHEKVSLADVDDAIKQEQFDFERMIPPEHYRVLARVCLSKDISAEILGSKLLFNTSVLEYDGDKRWNYVNPVVKNSDAFQKALREIQSPGSTDMINLIDVVQKKLREVPDQDPATRERIENVLQSIRQEAQPIS